MSEKQEKQAQETVVADNASLSSTLDDDRVLEEIGYVPSFKREFSNLATVSLIHVLSRTWAEYLADKLCF